MATGIANIWSNRISFLLQTSNVQSILKTVRGSEEARFKMIDNEMIEHGGPFASNHRNKLNTCRNSEAFLESGLD